MTSPGVRRAPLTAAQQDKWFFFRTMPPAAWGGMNLRFRLRIRTEHIPRLERSLSNAVARHEALRTIYREVDLDTIQEVLPPHPIRAERIPPAVALSAWMTAPIDASQLPAIRLGIVTVPAADWVVAAVCVHHLALDGIGAMLLKRELLLGISGAPIEPSDAPSPIDIALHEHSPSEQPRREQGLREALAVAASAPGRNLPRYQALEGVRLSVTSAELGRSFQDFAATYRATPAALLLSLYALFLATISRHETLHIEAYTADRQGDRIRSMGNLTTIMPCAIRLPEAASANDLLSQSKAAVLRGLRPNDWSWSQYYTSSLAQNYRDGCAPGGSFFDFIPDAPAEFRAQHAIVEPAHDVYHDGICYAARTHSGGALLHIVVPGDESVLAHARRFLSELPRLLTGLLNPSQNLQELLHGFGLPRHISPAVGPRRSLDELHTAAVSLQDHEFVDSATLTYNAGRANMDIHVSLPVAAADLHWRLWSSIAMPPGSAAPDVYRIWHAGTLIEESSGRTGSLWNASPNLVATQLDAIRAALKPYGIDLLPDHRNFLLDNVSVVRALALAKHLEFSGLTAADTVNAFGRTEDRLGSSSPCHLN